MDTRIADKLRKLLTLANDNPSPEESANAFAIAQALATKHRIELASIEIGADPADNEILREKISVVKGSKIMGWKKRLAWGMDSLGVYPLVYSGCGRVSFAGTRANVDTAIYMYRAISSEIERLAKAQASGQGRRFVNGFKLGAASMIVERLRDAHTHAVDLARDGGASETALACVGNAAALAKTWHESHNGKARTGRVSTTSAGGWSAGRQAGKSVNLGGNRAVGRGNIALPS